MRPARLTSVLFCPTHTPPLITASATQAPATAWAAPRADGLFSSCGRRRCANGDSWPLGQGVGQQSALPRSAYYIDIKTYTPTGVISGGLNGRSGSCSACFQHDAACRKMGDRDIFVKRTAVSMILNGEARHKDNRQACPVPPTFGGCSGARAGDKSPTAKAANKQRRDAGASCPPRGSPPEQAFPLLLRLTPPSAPRRLARLLISAVIYVSVVMYIFVV